ncbi:pilus assembly protein PilM [Rubellicoccus peritrichatus]|uniref:Pilus assembly protein PilM n=1 Tax=Rubellicoccus peritrichatus TaxID=3080537 RepID=A0AAQ3LA36_9BACT|nr:pilus assembly protein PilM [Puniceicoccus sp. CR14]WOO41886.1 pilus assembly protein PilM [Puniceicoccus sp. CR14]
MSSSKSLIVNCGASHVSASYYSTNNGSLTLDDFQAVDLEYDFSIEDDWLHATVQAVKSLTSSGYKGKATLIAPGYQLLTKSIKVPHVEKAKQQQIIAFEAQQNIPYPLSEVVWDNQVIADDGVETEVLLIAIKSEVINRFCQTMGREGLVTESVQASSILDYNAYRANYGDDSEDTLLINIGARASNLLFVNESGFFVRNIALGGNSLTQNLADNLGKPFQEAEQIKTAFFGGQTSYEPDHPSVQILQNNAQAFQKRLSQEITRSIVNYRRQKGTKAPVRILLAGRGSLLPGLSEYLSETQKVNVDYFNCFEKVAIGSGVDTALLESHRFNLSEAVGEASRNVLTDPVSINLLPQSLASEMAFEKKKPFLVVAAAALALATVPPILAYSQTSGAVQKDAKELQARVPGLQSLHGEIVANTGKAEAIRKDIASLETLVNSRSNWIIFFSDLQEQLQDVQDVWLEDLNLNRSSGNRLELSGRMLIKDFDPDNPTKSAQSAASRVNSLLERFQGSDFINSVADIKFDNTVPRILQFKFTLVTNPEKPL